MDERTVVFRISNYGKELTPQVAEAMRVKTEEESRQKMPWMWTLTDKLSTKSPNKSSGKTRKIIVSIVLMVLGIILLVPGIKNYGEMKLLFSAGVLCTGLGILNLWNTFKKDPFVKNAEKLMGMLNNHPGKEISFGEEGLDIAGEEIPYVGLKKVIMASDICLLILYRRVSLISKADIVEGTFEQFEELLDENDIEITEI